MVGDDRFRRALDGIDAANAEDPNLIEFGGELRPKELVHAELMTEWVQRLRPDPSEPLLLAARAHHLRRWVIPRSDYPDGRSGYLRWRRRLHELHASEVGQILAEAGYDDETIARVKALVAKRDQPPRGVADDPDARAIEDGLCLVFITTQFATLADRLDDEKMVQVVRKVLNKMSPEGVSAALKLYLGVRERALLQRAVSAN